MRCFPLLCLLLIPSAAPAYSVLTHEAIIDSAWEDSIKPLLLRRFPNSTPAEILQAHGYAYGGAIIQDMGYYPAGSHLFSDLTHYVQSGAFIMNMIESAQDLNEYAFALGSLAHYAADDEGHSIAVNRSVPMLYPKLRAKYGEIMTYEQDPTAHLRTEFAFDVLQVARGYYAPTAYHDFIGFHVSRPALERAFQATYCLRLEDLFTNLDHSLSSYRHVVSGIIPEATKVAWVLKKKEIQQHFPDLARRKFVYNISRSSYEKEWGRDYEKPGIGARLLAFLLRILPHIGPLKDLSFQAPTAQAEDLFMKSFDSSLAEYRRLLKETGAGTLKLAEMNFDTGQPSRPGAYRLADQARAELAQDWAKKGITACPVATSAARNGSYTK